MFSVHGVDTVMLPGPAAFHASYEKGDGSLKKTGAHIDGADTYTLNEFLNITPKDARI